MILRTRQFWILLCVVLLLGIMARSYKINNGLTEWFSWRQSDTAAVGKLYAKNGIDLLKPRFYDLSSIQSGKENPQGIRMVEFPLYNASFAVLYKMVPRIPVEVWARTVTAVLSLCALAVIFAILYKEIGPSGAFFGGMAFALTPYIVFYSRSILPDMPATSLAVIAIGFAYLYWLRKKWWILIPTTIVFSLALLVKPMALFYGIVIFYLVMRTRNVAKRWWVRFLIAGLVIGIACVPLALWRNYIRAFPEGIPASDWLLTSVNTSAGLQTVWFRPAFFRWIFYERIQNLILGGYLLFFVLLGICYSHRKTKLHYAFFISALSYLLVFQGGNVQHDYYQILITPALAVLIGCGAALFLQLKLLKYLAFRYLFVTVIFLAGIGFSWYHIKPYYNENTGIQKIAQAIRTFTTENDKIVLDAIGDTTILYMADRYGYPAPYKDFDLFKKENGATFFVTTDSGYEQKFADSTYNLVYKSDTVLIFRL